MAAADPVIARPGREPTGQPTLRRCSLRHTADVAGGGWPAGWPAWCWPDRLPPRS